VLLPWYKEPFYWLSTVLSSLLVLLFAGYAIHRQLNLGRLVSERTATLSIANEELLVHRRHLQNLTAELSLTEERERRRLATDLHDSVSQSLALSIMKLDILNQSQPAENETRQLSQIRQQLNQTLSVTQDLMFELCPPILHQFGLGAAIQQLIWQMQKDHGIAIDYEEDKAEKPLSDDLSYFLFRSTREFLMNVIKHARATHAKVFVRRTGGMIQVQVIDDGKGFTELDWYPVEGKAGGFGLFSIRERVHQIGGCCEIQSRPGIGTIVSLSVPLAVSENGEKKNVSENQNRIGG